MYAPAHSKRRRSPSPLSFESPDLSLPSPLDVIAKRRRKHPGPGFGDLGSSNDYFSHGNTSGAANNINVETANPDSSALYAERRRTKQWERLNAPRPPLHHTGQSQPHLDYTPPHSHLQSHIQAQALTRSYSQPEAHLPSPVHQYPHSQPLPQHHMSSSPIRHEPFGSSPFRSSSSTNIVTPSGFASSSTRVGVQDTQEEDDSMDTEEMRRGWGEQYAQQNELLHSIHRERRQAQQGHPHFSPLTPSIHTPHNYRTAHYSSSPFEHPSSARSHSMMMDQDQSDGMAHGSDGMEAEVDPEVKRRYEDANRLLAELDVVRNNRWKNRSFD